ncbi:Uncharacterised protein [Sphingobacterium spiritivorum]|uniref:Uncharacterized protein n=1 Tax=Sphingobacterium spiritivorum TaxID=258 RepID=A0A380BHL0_SPHSI|nr:Uncharacterised protein [Sphingobacterium spiritivorum]
MLSFLPSAGYQNVSQFCIVINPKTKLEQIYEKFTLRQKSYYITPNHNHYDYGIFITWTTD